MQFRSVGLDALTIDDRRSFSHVALYGVLEQALRRSRHRFLIPAEGATASWDRALFLNLTYWNGEEGAEVFCDDHVPADVVAHVAWHHIVNRELARRQAGPPGPEALFFAESIASAFDLYLVGRLLPNAADSDFVTTQVPLMSECAEAAGLPAAAFAALIEEVTREPERAFEDLRALLFDVSNALVACRGALEAQAALEGFAGHRFQALLHHFQLSNWILYARAFAGGPRAPAPAVAEADAALRQAPVSLDWLAAHWVDADKEPGSAGR
jgi:hypothetical protein